MSYVSQSVCSVCKTPGGVSRLGRSAVAHDTSPSNCPTNSIRLNFFSHFRAELIKTSKDFSRESSWRRSSSHLSGGAFPFGAKAIVVHSSKVSPLCKLRDCLFSPHRPLTLERRTMTAIRVFLGTSMDFMGLVGNRTPRPTLSGLFCSSIAKPSQTRPP